MATSNPIRRYPWPVLFTLASLVVVVAGLKAASPLLEPFLLAIFFSIFCAPGVNLLRRFRFPEWLAVGVVVILLLMSLTVIVAAMGASINGFVRHLPAYQEVLTQRLEAIIRLVQSLGVNVDPAAIRSELDIGALVSQTGKLAGRLGSMVGSLFLVLLAVVFILLEAARFPDKLQAAFGKVDQGLDAFNSFSKGVKNYLAIKSIFSLATGILVTFWLWLCGVDYPILWGILAFFFNYIPSIGSFLAAVPACILAFVLHGTGFFVLVATGYVVINVMIGSMLEPRFLGRSLGLSTLVVFCSLLLWGWVLGPVGMVLSVPLTMIVRIGLDSREETRWMAVLLGPEVKHQTQ